MHNRAAAAQRCVRPRGAPPFRSAAAPRREDAERSASAQGFLTAAPPPTAAAVRDPHAAPPVRSAPIRVRLNGKLPREEAGNFGARCAASAPAPRLPRPPGIPKSKRSQR